ncbi:hypothetical protein [Aequorivita nionensis]|uniref:hypothetical protein n=1 Tax=Aequorivita nionensis TaxID=1287690 RepID=UPI003965C7C0
MNKNTLLISLFLLVALGLRAQICHTSHFGLNNTAVTKIEETEYVNFHKPRARKNTYQFDAKGYVTQETFEYTGDNTPTVTQYIYDDNHTELTKQLMDEYGQPVKFFGKSGPYKIYDTPTGLLFDYPVVEKNAKGEVIKLKNEKKGMEKTFETKSNQLTYCYITENGIQKPEQVYDKNQRLLGTVQYNFPETYYSYENNVPVDNTYFISKLAFKYVYEFDGAGNWIKKITFSALPTKKYQWELIAINTRIITYTDSKLNTKPNDVLHTLDVSNFDPIRKQYEVKYIPTDVIDTNYFTQREAAFKKLLK